MQEPTAVIPGSTEPLAPLAAEDADAFLADVSDSERMCLSDNIPSDRMAMLTTTPELATEVERETFLGCLEHNTLLRLLLTPVLSATGPLSVESSACMRSSYADKDLAALMSSVVADPGTGPEAEAAMAQGMVMFFRVAVILERGRVPDGKRRYGVGTRRTRKLPVRA